MYHHERFDGGGYPKGLAKDDIPISAQVVGLADASVSCKKGQKMVKFVPALGEETFDTVYVNLDTLRTYARKMDAPIQLPCSTDKTRYYATSFYINDFNKERECEVNVTGFILQKK